MITLTEIEEALAWLYQNEGGILTLKNYISATDKSVTPELVLRYEGADLYPKIVRESLDAYEAGALEDVRPKDIKIEDWQQAMNEQTMAWKKVIEGDPMDFQSKLLATREKNYSRDPRGFWRSRVVQEMCGIENLRRLSELPDRAPVAHRNDVTRAKAIIRDRTPSSRYVGILTLEPNKAESLTVSCKA